MKVMMKSNLTVSTKILMGLSTAAAALMLVGCGGVGGSDPLADKPAFKGLAEEAGDYEKTGRIEQQYYENYVVFSPAPTNDFSVGVESSTEVSVLMGLNGVKWDLSGDDLPEGAKFVLKKEEGNRRTYNLVWAPSVRLLPGDEYKKTFKFTYKVVVTDPGSPANAEILKTVDMTYPGAVTAIKPHVVPKIEAFQKLPAQVVEGSVTPFTIDVLVPNSEASRTPKWRAFRNEKECTGEGRCVYDGSHFVREASKPKFLENGIWRFNLIFDTENYVLSTNRKAVIERLNGQEGINVGFNIEVDNLAGAVSPPASQTVFVALSADGLKAPLFDQDDSTILNVTANKASAIRFTVTNQGTYGVVQIDEAAVTNQIKSWPGTPTFKRVTQGASNAVTYELAWNVPCEAKDQTFKVNLAATVSLNGKTASSELEKKIQIAPGSCAASGGTQ